MSTVKHIRIAKTALPRTGRGLDAVSGGKGQSVISSGSSPGGGVTDHSELSGLISSSESYLSTEKYIHLSAEKLKEIGDSIAEGNRITFINGYLLFDNAKIKAGFADDFPDTIAKKKTFSKGITVEGGTVTDMLTASGKVVALDIESSNNIKSKTAEISDRTTTDTLRVIGNAKSDSLDVAKTTTTNTLVVADLTKSGNAEITNNLKTKDLEVAELARIRDLVVTRLAEVLNLSVTDVATLARTIVKESISSETFIPGFAGEGFKIWQLAGGDWTGEFDSITIRKTLTAFELLISKIRAVKGSLAITQANGKIKKVLDQSPVYSLEIDETMSFTSGDLVRCQTWQSTGSKYYWVTVVRVEGNSIICNKAEFNGVVPSVGDELVQMGHVSDPFRQSMVYLDASSGRPSIDVLSGINTKSFAGKLKVRLGCLDGITDTDFPSDMQPSGYGLYCTNGFFKGMFVLQSGKTVEDYAGGLVDAIQVGGRNLVKNSKMNLSAISDNPYTFTVLPLCEPIKSNTTYAFSVEKTEIVSGSTTDSFSAIAYSPSEVKDYVNIKIPISQNKQQGIYTTPDVSGDCIFLLYSGVVGNSQDRKLRWTGLKIEEGNKATAWTPALEDVDAAIKTAQDAAGQAQSDANTANGAITRIDTELSALPGEITAAVTKTTTAYTDDKIADIQIGGVNLLINSAVERHGSVGLEYLNLFDPTTVFDRLGVGTYTISFDAKSAIEGNMHFYSTPGVVANFKYVFKTVNGVDVTTNGIFGVNFNVTTEYKRYVFVVEIMGSNPASAISSVSLYGFYNSGKIPYVKNIKFEQGNKATGWSPAPEDSAAALKSVRTELDSRLTVTERDITQKVSQSDFNALGQRVGTAEASIETQADEIALTVTKEEFDNLQMSGRNVFRASGNFIDFLSIADFWADNGGGCVIDTDVLFNGHNTICTAVGSGIQGIWYKLENGVEYTYSAMIRSNENYTGDRVTPLHYWAGKDNVSQGNFRVVKYDTSLVAGVWKLIYVTFKLINDANSFHPFIYAHTNGTRVFNIAFMCLTKGNVPMINWEPAIEDVNDTIAKQEARITLTEQKIALTVTENDIKSGIAITPGGIGVFGEYHSLNGMFTFSSFSQEAQNIINGKATTGYVDTAKDAAITASQNNVAEKMGYVNYADMEAKAIDGQSIITGGKIRTVLIDADAIVTKALVTQYIDADYIQGKTLNFTKGTIGGWNIDGDSLYSGVKAADSTYATLGMTIRSNGSISSKNFRIDKDGNVFGQNCEFTDGRFVGVVTATSGKIGGFDLDQDRIGTKSGDEGMSLYNSFIKFKYGAKEARLGSNVLSVSSGGSLLCSLKNERSSYSANICLELSAKNGNPNYAIDILNGCIAGFAINTRVIEGSDNLYDTDVFVRSSEYNTSNPTYHLPPDPTIGKVIITCNSTMTISVSGNGRIIKANRENRNLIDIGGNTKMAIFIWDGQYWQYNHFNN